MNIPITRDEWKALEGKGQWDVKAALRGPDLVNSEMIKWFGTSVIRGKLRNITRVGGMVNDDLGIIIVAAGGSGKDHHAGFDHHHYFAHLRDAASWLGIPVMLVTKGVYWEDYPTYHDRCKAFVEFAKTYSARCADELLSHYNRLIGRGM